MYEPFYGFKLKPFALLPQEEFMFLSRQHRMALDLLIYALTNRALFCVVSGDIGTGKTTLLRFLLGRHAPNTAVGMITGMSGTYQVCSSGILGKFAKQLDVQMDDGNTATGSLRVVADAAALGSAALATTAVDDATSYTVCMTF